MTTLNLPHLLFPPHWLTSWANFLPSNSKNKNSTRILNKFSFQTSKIRPLTPRKKKEEKKKIFHKRKNKIVTWKIWQRKWKWKIERLKLKNEITDSKNTSTLMSQLIIVNIFAHYIKMYYNSHLIMLTLDELKLNSKFSITLKFLVFPLFFHFFAFHFFFNYFVSH